MKEGTRASQTNLYMATILCPEDRDDGISILYEARWFFFSFEGGVGEPLGQRCFEQGFLTGRALDTRMRNCFCPGCFGARSSS